MGSKKYLYFLFLLTNIFIIEAGLLCDLVSAKLTSGLLICDLEIDCCTNNFELISDLGEDS